MTNYAWSFCGVVLSVMGLAVSATDDKPTKPAADHEHSHAEMSIPKAAVAVLSPTKGNKVRGTVRLSQTEDGVRFQGMVRNLEPGEHGFHIHEFGDLRGTDGKAAGGHFNPEGHKHGGPDAKEHHAGDLGNITANEEGVAKVDTVAKGLKLHFVLGRSIVVHGGKDDLQSQPSGDAGPRVALGVIGYAGPNPRMKKAADKK